MTSYAGIRDEVLLPRQLSRSSDRSGCLPAIHWFKILDGKSMVAEDDQDE